MKFFRQLLEKRIVRYLISGVTSFCIENATFLVLYYGVKLHVRPANIASVLVALSANFLLTRYFVFRHNAPLKAAKSQLVRYGLLAVFNITASTYGVGFMVHSHVPGFVAKPLMTMLVACWNYVLYRTVIFKKDAEPLLVE